MVKNKKFKKARNKKVTYKLWFLLIKFIPENKILFLCVVFFSISLLSIIRWGIPNSSHPFPYHMDEWHQLQAVRSLFKYGSPNIEGAAHGPILNFLFAGIYLIPYVLLGIVNPFLINSSVSQLDMQEKLFIVLRLNTLLFSILSIFFIGLIGKKYLKTHSGLNALLFCISPLWIVLSNYFKYDVALTFWIILSIYFLFKFAAKPSLKNYILAGIVCACALATKVSALPIVLIYIFSFFYFTKKQKKSFLIVGLLAFGLTVILVGIPDLLLGLGDYREYLYSNLVSGPQGESNILTGSPWWMYILFTLSPLILGHILYVFFIFTFIFWIGITVKCLYRSNLKKYKNEIFLCISLCLFIASLVPLRLGATGNRLVVILPYLSLLTASLINIFYRHINRKKIFSLLVGILLAFQLYQSSIFINARFLSSPLERASVWIVHNIRLHSVIGIENVPIYQGLPDILLKEYYEKEGNKTTKTLFEYQIIDVKTPKLPSIIIITNRVFHTTYLKSSPKKDLLQRMQKENFKIVTEFKPYDKLFHIFGNYLNYHQSGLNTVSLVTVYRKTN